MNEDAKMETMNICEETVIFVYVIVYENSKRGYAFKAIVNMNVKKRYYNCKKR